MDMNHVARCVLVLTALTADCQFDVLTVLSTTLGLLQQTQMRPEEHAMQSEPYLNVGASELRMR